MTGRKVFITGLSAVFAVSLLTASTAEAGRKTAAAIGIGALVGIGLLAATSAGKARNRSRGRRYQGRDVREDAVNACVGVAEDKLLRRPGGRYVRLRRVSRVRFSGKRTVVVTAKISNAYDWGLETVWFHCKYSRGRVKSFSYI